VIKTVLFDLDGTLYDRDFLVRSLAERQYQIFVGELQHVGQSRYVDRLIELDDHGYQPKSDVYRLLVHEFGLSPSMEERLENHFWSDSDSYCKPFDDTEYTLKALRRRGKRLGIITNGQSKRQRAKIEALGVGSLFDVILVSEEVGFRKPDPNIFKRAVDECDSLPGEAMYVGDNPQADIEGARNAGLTAVWKSVPYWKLSITDVSKIDSLSELLTMVDSDPLQLADSNR
jgi:putative hydrolase of the HAD superfamily